MSDQGRLDYKLPGNKKVNLSLFWATNFFGADDKKSIDRAEEMLKEHGMGLNCAPSSKLKTADRTFDFGFDLIPPDRNTDVYRTLSAVADAAGQRQHLIVLFCQYIGPAHGKTIFEGPKLCFRTPMVYISPTAGSDGATLLHEAGHAAGLDHDRTSTGTTGRNLMNETVTRTTIMKWQLEKLGKAFFIS
jgi:hypothetical protein